MEISAKGKLALAGALGLLSGGAIGYLISDLIWKKKAERVEEELNKEFTEKLDQEITLAKEHYEEKLRIAKIEGSEKAKNDILNTIQKVYAPELTDEKEEKELEEKIFLHTKPKEKVNYTKYNNKKAYLDQYQEELEDEDDEDDEDDEITSIGPREEPRIYPISAKDYHQTNTHFDKTELVYFNEDGILSNEEGEDLSDVLKYTVGEDFLSAIDSETEEGFIRNEKNSTDYDILIEHASYYDTFVKE